MTTLLFPDNTVLINFALIDRMDLLERIARVNGRWCATVAKECHDSSQYEGLAALSAAPGIFGEPLRPETPAEHLATKMYRDQLAGPGDEPYKHLGEAETLAIITERRDLTAAFVTDDGDGARLATALGVPVYTTWHLLKIATKAGLLPEADLWAYVQKLVAENRNVPHDIRNQAGMLYWLAR